MAMSYRRLVKLVVPNAWCTTEGNLYKVSYWDEGKQEHVVLGWGGNARSAWRYAWFRSCRAATSMA